MAIKKKTSRRSTKISRGGQRSGKNNIPQQIRRADFSLRPAQLATESFGQILEKQPEVSHPALLAFLVLPALAASDPRIPKPAEKYEMDGDGTLTVRRGHIDPITGQFVEEEVDVYGPGLGGVRGPFLRRTRKRPHGTSTTEEFSYDSRGRLEEIEVVDENGRLLRTYRYKHDSQSKVLRIDETDENGKTTRVITLHYYSDGTILITITDYSTSPATVIQYITGPPIPAPI